ADTAAVNLGGTFTTAGLGTFTRTGAGGTVNLTGQLEHTGAVLHLGAGPTPVSWNLAGGTIAGGTVSAAVGSALVLTQSSGLAGVTLDGTGPGTPPSPLDMQTPFNAVTVAGGLTLKGATLRLGDNLGNARGQLF